MAMKTHWIHLLIILSMSVFHSLAVSAENELPYYLHDRGTGVSTSMFGTYINEGEFIFYPFYEYYTNKDEEYSTAELGFGADQDFRAKYEAHEVLIFLGYGINDMLAFEFEAAAIEATQYKADDDPTSMPNEITESGLGDVQAQLRWRYNKETADKPEYFSYFETVLPLQKDKKIIGTPDWEYKLGFGATSGFKWGTVTGRVSMEYVREEDKLELGEYAIEYLKRVSETFRYYVGLEGAQDEVEFIVDLQFHISPKTFVRVNNAFGATSKAVDYAPEVGVVFYF